MKAWQRYVSSNKYAFMVPTISSAAVIATRCRTALHRPPDDAPRVDIEDAGQVHTTFTGSNVGGARLRSCGLPCHEILGGWCSLVAAGGLCSLATRAAP